MVGRANAAALIETENAFLLHRPIGTEAYGLVNGGIRDNEQPADGMRRALRAVLGSTVDDRFPRPLWSGVHSLGITPTHLFHVSAAGAERIVRAAGDTVLMLPKQVAALELASEAQGLDVFSAGALRSYMLNGGQITIEGATKWA